LTIDVAGTLLSESVDVVAGDASRPMTQDQVVDKFTRYVEPSLGRRGVDALVSFCLEGGRAEPARRCFDQANP
jgi:hypothetical protein